MKRIWDQGKRVAVHRSVYSVAFCEHKRATAVGSQQRMKSRHHSASRSSGLQKSCATQAGSQSSNGTIAARLGKLIRAEMIPVAVDSGSEIAVPSSTAKNCALQRPRLSPLKDSRSRRHPKAAPRQILRCVHAGSETVSPGGPKPPVLSRTRQHDMKATIPARASWRSQRVRWRGLAGNGIRRRLEARRERAVAISSLTNFVNSVSLEKEDINAKNMGHPL